MPVRPWGFCRCSASCPTAGGEASQAVGDVRGPVVIAVTVLLFNLFTPRRSWTSLSLCKCIMLGSFFFPWWTCSVKTDVLAELDQRKHILDKLLSTSCFILEEDYYCSSIDWVVNGVWNRISGIKMWSHLWFGWRTLILAHFSMHFFMQSGDNAALPLVSMALDHVLSGKIVCWTMLL